MTNPPGPAAWRAPLERRIAAMAAFLAVWVTGIEARLVYLQVVDISGVESDRRAGQLNCARTGRR